MTIPPTKLQERLWRLEKIVLRSADNGFDSIISATDAMALAIRGLIEGVVGKPHGPLRYVRYLKGTAAMDAADVKHIPREEDFKSTCTAFAKTRLGVYAEPLFQPIIVRGDTDTDVHVVGETQEVIGHTYAFYSAAG